MMKRIVLAILTLISATPAFAGDVWVDEGKQMSDYVARGFKIVSVVRETYSVDFFLQGDKAVARCEMLPNNLSKEPSVLFTCGILTPAPAAAKK